LLVVLVSPCAWAQRLDEAALERVLGAGLSGLNDEVAKLKFPRIVRPARRQ
jgi:hypothetical protein